MLFSQIDGRSPERARFRNTQSPMASENVLRLCCRQLSKAQADGELLMLGHQQPVVKAQLVAKVAGVSHSKSPKGIDITDLYLRDDTDSILVSFYKNDFPSDVLSNLLSAFAFSHPNQLLGHYVHVCVSPRPNPTNKYRPFRHIAVSARPVEDLNDLTVHRLGVIKDHCVCSYGQV